MNIKNSSGSPESICHRYFFWYFYFLFFPVSIIKVRLVKKNSSSLLLWCEILRLTVKWRTAKLCHSMLLLIHHLIFPALVVDLMTDKHFLKFPDYILLFLPKWKLICVHDMQNCPIHRTQHKLFQHCFLVNKNNFDLSQKISQHTFKVDNFLRQILY